MADILTIADPPFEVEATLHFLKDGHYLFRCYDKGRITSKFVTSEDVATAFARLELDSGWLQPGIVCHGHSTRGNWFVYTIPAQKTKLNILLDKKAGMIQVPIPRIVLLGVDRNYYLWAVKSKEFDPNAVAFRAPFPNIFSSNGICWGSNNPPPAHHTVAKKVWQLFIESPFNHGAANDKSVAYPKDVCRQLVHLAQRNARCYPLKDLVPADGQKTVAQLVKQHIEKH